MGFAQVTRDKIWVQYHIQESVEESRQYVDWLPVYSLRAACGKFGEGQDVEALGWVRADGAGDYRLVGEFKKVLSLGK